MCINEVVFIIKRPEGVKGGKELNRRYGLRISDSCRVNDKGKNDLSLMTLTPKGRTWPMKF